MQFRCLQNSLQKWEYVLDPQSLWESCESIDNEAGQHDGMKWIQYYMYNACIIGKSYGNVAEANTSTCESLCKWSSDPVNKSEEQSSSRFTEMSRNHRQPTDIFVKL